MTHDIDNNEYARVQEIRENTIVKCDGDFTCLEPWTYHTVYFKNNSLCLICKDDYHNLEGQLNEEGTHYIGLYRA